MFLDNCNLSLLYVRIIHLICCHYVLESHFNIILPRRPTTKFSKFSACDYVIHPNNARLEAINMELLIIQFLSSLCCCHVKDFPSESCFHTLSVNVVPSGKRTNFHTHKIKMKLVS
jgi:hypothetical protein